MFYVVPIFTVIIFAIIGVMIIKRIGKLNDKLPQIDDYKKENVKQENLLRTLSEKEEVIVKKELIDFYYVSKYDKDRYEIEIFFDDFLDRNKITKLTSKLINSSDINNEINILGKNSLKYTTSIENEKEITPYEPSLREKTLFVLNDLIINKHLSIITDHIEIDFSETNKFKTVLAEIEKYMKLDNKEIDNTIKRLNQEDAKSEFYSLEKLRDLIALQGHAIIKYDDDNKYVTLQLEHPLNNYNQDEINIIVRFPNQLFSNKIEGLFKDHANSNETLNVIIFGKLLRTVNIKRKEFAIKINPYIVYA